MSIANDEPQYRQWQWIFRALWSAAPKSVEVTHSARRTRCHLHLLVPDTILFQRGEPCKWLGSSPEGIVVRKSFYGVNGPGESVTANTTSTADAPSELRREALATRVAAGRQSPSSRRMDDFETVERLDTVIAAFVAFAATHSSSSSSSLSSSTGPDAETDVPVCVARYNDGTTELLSSKSLQTLCRFFNWRTSLCALQAYVYPGQGSTATTIGTYDRRHARQGRARRHRHPESPTSAIGAGSVTRRYTGPWSSSRDLTIEDDRPTLDSATDGASSSSRPPGASKAALDQAAKDVAFVTDMSYAWPPEPSRTTPRFGPRNATAANSNIPRDPEDSRTNENPENAMDTNKVQADSRPVVVVGETAGQPRRPAPPWPKSRVRVFRLDAEFVIDQNGCPWLTNAPKVCFAERVCQYSSGCAY